MRAVVIILLSFAIVINMDSSSHVGFVSEQILGKLLSLSVLCCAHF